MRIYKVWIQIEEIDEGRDHYLELGTPYEAGRFDSQARAVKFVENELMITRPINMRLQKACRQVLESLDVGGEQSRAFAEEIQILRDALKASAKVKVECPGCGAGPDKREFIQKDRIDAQVIHVHNICEKCGSRITEQFALTAVFTDSPHAR